MRRFAYLCAAYLLCTPLMHTARAESSVSIYGTADGGIRYLSNAAPGGGSRIYMGSNGWNSSNKVDIAGTETLDSGLEVHFLLESGFQLASGTLDNKTNTLFQRQSYVGVKSDWGTVNLGRQYTIAHDFLSDYDPFHFNYTSLIPLTKASSGTRFDNDVKYIGRFGPFKLELENAFGEEFDSANDGSAHGVGLQYYGDSLTVGASYNRRSVPVGSTYRNQRYYLTGIAYRIGSLRISGGYMIDSLDRRSDGPDSVARNIFGGASYAFTKQLKLTGGIYHTTSSTDNARGKDMAIVGMDYMLSKRTKLYAAVDYTKYKSAEISPLNTAGAAHQLGLTSGINHRF